MAAVKPDRDGRVRRILTPSQLRALYDSGLSYAQIAARVGTTRQAVHDRLRRLPGFRARGHDELWRARARQAGLLRRKPVDIKLAVRLFEDGTRAHDIAARVGVSARTLRKRLAEAGVWRLRKLPVRRRRRLTDPVLADIRRRLAAGESYSRIAARHGISKGMVSHVARGRWPK